LSRLNTARPHKISYRMSVKRSSDIISPLTSAQIRAARALIRWSAQDLARVTKIGIATIRRAELTEDQTSLTPANDQAIRRALEEAGVEFISGNGGGPGVRLQEPIAKKPA
jgi:transcriptional regulator with XRE-family HTH domain